MASKPPTGAKPANWAFPTVGNAAGTNDVAAAERKAAWQANQDRLRALHHRKASTAPDLLESLTRRTELARQAEEENSRLESARRAEELDHELVRLREAGAAAAATHAAAAERAKGPTAQMICPHCQVKGTVQLRPVSRKKGVSGGKAVAALMTGGLSMLAVGLSRKERETEAHCSNCMVTWHF